MESWYLDVFSAFWLGVLTSISPCPLATNVAAISFVARSMGSSQKVLWSGVLYSIGRMLVYIVIAVLAVGSLLSLPEVSFFLVTNMHKIIGPLLILVGIVLLEVLPISFSTSVFSNSIQNRAGRLGLWGSGLLGLWKRQGPLLCGLNFPVPGNGPCSLGSLTPIISG